MQVKCWSCDDIYAYSFYSKTPLPRKCFIHLFSVFDEQFLIKAYLVMLLMNFQMSLPLT